MPPMPATSSGPTHRARTRPPPAKPETAAFEIWFPAESRHWLRIFLLVGAALTTWQAIHYYVVWQTLDQCGEACGLREAVVPAVVQGLPLLVVGPLVFLIPGLLRTRRPRILRSIVGGCAALLVLSFLCCIVGYLLRLTLEDTVDFRRVVLRTFGAAFIHLANLVGLAMAATYAESERLSAIAEGRLRVRLLGNQLRSLRAQLRPHFLYNALNSVSALLSTNPEGAVEVLGMLRRLLSLADDSDGKEMTTVRQEMEAAALYLQVEQVRFEDGLTTRVDVDPSALDLPVPRMLLQPLLENAVVHGAKQDDGRGDIGIRVTRAGNTLVFEVTDTGPGLRPAGQHSGTGIGVANTRARLATLYGPRATIELENRPERGVLARVRIPVDVAGAAASPTAASERNDPEPYYLSRSFRHIPKVAIATFVLFWVVDGVTTSYTVQALLNIGWRQAILSGASEVLGWGGVTLLAYAAVVIKPRAYWRWYRVAILAVLLAPIQPAVDVVLMTLYGSPPPWYPLSYIQALPGLISYVLIALAAGIGIRHFLDLAARAAEVRRLASDNERARLELLRAYVAPEILDDAIGMLITLARIDPARADRSLIRFADVLRATLTPRPASPRSVGSEIDLVKEWLAVAPSLSTRVSCEFPTDAATRAATVTDRLPLLALLDLAIQASNAGVGQVQLRIDGGEDGALLVVSARTEGEVPEAFRDALEQDIRTLGDAFQRAGHGTSITPSQVAGRFLFSGRVGRAEPQAAARS
jgi:LytS/YehU family sensor histidine kinase